MMNYVRTPAIVLLLVCLGVSGCATTGDSVPSSANDNMDAVVWQQTSAEYAAVTTGIYASATTALEAIAKTDRARSMAVVLDNVPYQAQLVLDDATYEGESWDRWVALRAAPATPGVVDFIRASQSLGVHVVFITNRRCRARPDSTGDCPQKDDTLANLQDIGIDTTSTTLFLRGEIPP